MAEVTRLSNGIKIALEHLPYLRTVSFGVWVRIGSAGETKSNNGISHMIEHMLFKGTHNRSAKEIADLTSSIGDDVNAFTSKEVTCYYGSTVTEFLPTLIDLIADMLQESSFNENDIRKEKRVICDEIDMYEDSPEDLVHELLQQRIFKDQSLGYIISGNKTVVRNFTKQQLLSFMKLHYTADNMIISVAGNFDKNDLIKLLEEKFKNIPRGSKKASNVANAIKKQQEIRLEPYQAKYEHMNAKNQVLYHNCFCTKHKEIEQLHINLAFPAISIHSSKNDIFSIFNSILGGSNNSRLFQKIREDLGLAYSIYSYGSSFDMAGLFHIDITINPSQADAVLGAVDEVLKDIRDHGITKEELETHKAQVITEFIMSSESAKSRMNSNAKSLMIRGRIRTLDEALEGLKKVTLEDINLFAKQILDMEKLSICLVGPKTGNSFTRIKKKWLQMKEDKL
ncbi:M16 family metallopeptidase [Clostridium sp. Marseille-P299]|uniref:M16 family metallopeptidase n=1 Tax=Clostridium sp. Marseille-P299 TaxID=1805477 RepID=UPI00082DCF02|nr:pitrilysin family protein [Clostridium sp. Marseille-P299]